MVSVIDRAQLVVLQQFGQLPRIDAIILITFLQQSVSAGSQTTSFETWGLSKSYNQAAHVPSSKVTCTSPRSPSTNCRIMFAFVSMAHSITTLPAEFLTAIEILSLCTSMPIYFVLSIQGVPFC